MKDKEFILPFGIFSTIVVTVVGVGIFAFPRNVAKFVGGDGWFIAAIVGLISFLLLYLIYFIVDKNDYQNFNNILQNNFGKVFGSIFALFFAAYTIFIIILGIRVFVEVVKMYLLEKTPAEFLIVVTILTALYVIRGGIESLIRFNEISFWIMFISIGIVLLFSLSSADFTNILPVMTHSFGEYFQALKFAIYSFTGFEILYLIMPFCKNKKLIKRSLVKSMTFITLFYIIMFIFTIAILSKEQTVKLLWPTITMVKAINIPGAFVERWDGIVMSLWIIFFYTTFTNEFYFISDIFKNTFRLKSIKISSAIVVPLLYVSSLYPQNIADVYRLSSKYMPMLAGINLVVLPLLIMILTFLRQRKKERGK